MMLNFAQREILGTRSCEMLDILFLMQKKNFGQWEEDTVIDLSQALERKCFSYIGSTPTPTTSMTLYHMGLKRFLYPHEMFQIQGWKADEVKISPIKDWQARTLTGNTMSLPCVGVVLAAVISEVPLGTRSGPKDYTSFRSSLG
eukprot:9496206-Pyramimonas_sp.AAC.2